MIKKEDIKKWLEDQPPLWLQFDKFEDVVHKCITELSQDKWVSVEDRLPDDGDQVIAFKKASSNREWLYLCDYEDGEFIVPGIGIFEPQLWRLLEPPNDK